MHEIIDDLTDDDLEGFADDCLTLGAKKTRKYTKACIKDREFDASIAQMYLAVDFSGI